jgi:ribonuclease-3
VVGVPEVLRALPSVDDDGEPSGSAGELRPRLAVLESRLGYTFARPSLLRAALTLGSWANEHPDAGWPSNACLEFFGDAVLDLLAADAVWQRHPLLDEGELTRLRAVIVAEPALADVATAVDLGAFLWLGRGDDRLGGRRHRATLADALEAVLGAVFLDARERGDAPLAAAAHVFARLFETALDAAHPQRALDPKTRLQHWAQALHRVAPTYVRIDARGGDGPPRWRARVELRHPGGDVQVLGEGEGESLREAERRAAESALAIVDETPAG